ncbi:hypothetical protein FGO68_gene3696 [Halteria grandinella]|uniref:Thioredoxin domain-containing protein n=1 Tax=Halteria grandinella TaxID=5974 RepID=A0A8J8P4A8_HALGN|nr:hypothetical protein FGO68_gene3696 [Halteria grandinella]
MLRHLLYKQQSFRLTPYQRCLTYYNLQHFSKKPPPPKTHQQMAMETQESQKYDYKKDPRIRNVLKNFFIFFIIVTTSGKATEYLVNRYVLGDQSGQSIEDKYKGQGDGAEQQKRRSVDKEKVPYLTPTDLQNKAFFARGRNYFIQVVHDSDSDPVLSPQFYQLKRLSRKKSQPLFAFKLRLSDFIQPQTNADSIEPSETLNSVLGKAFNISDVETWREIRHIVVNEDGMKMPVFDDGGAIAFKFLQNPTKIDNLDDLYDAFEVNKGTNVKYLLICNPGTHASPADMSLQQKLFRKFFYENSTFLESECKFIELTNKRVAARIGLTSEDMIVAVQNRNELSPFSADCSNCVDTFKLMNLELESVKCEDVRQEVLEKKYARYLKDMSKREFEQEFLLGEERIEETFGYLSKFIEDTLLTRPKFIYAQTSRMLKFYKNYLRRRQMKVLFIQLEGAFSDQRQKEILEKLTAFKEKNPDVKVLLTDLKEASSLFSLLEDNTQETDVIPPLHFKTCRLIDYGALVNAKTLQTISLDSLNDPLVKQKHEKDLDYLYFLKYQLTEENLTQNKPHFESSISQNQGIEGIQEVNRENYSNIFKNKEYTVVEVYAKRCPGCKHIDPIIPSIKERLDEKKTQLVRVDVLNEVPFLKNIDKTPSFLLFNRRKGTYTLVDTQTKTKEEQDELYEDKEKLIQVLVSRINEAIKKS